MNYKTLALLGGALLLAGCPGDDTDNTDPATTDTAPTDEPTPTPDPFEWTVVLTDGDGVADPDADGNGIPDYDADTTAVTTENSVGNYPDVVTWEFGFGQTANVGGWFGEDCDGIDDGTGDRCHPMDPDTTMTLTRVATIGEINPGTTTLNNVDFPESSTPALTYVIHGLDSTSNELVCLRMGDDPSYYNGAGCEDFVAPM